MHDRVSKSPGSVYSVAMLTLILSLAAPTVLRFRALAQNATGSINGTVTDPDDQVLTKAVVTLTNKTNGTIRKGISREDGNFAFETLPPGEYEVRIEAQGFKTEIQMIEVQVGKSSTANFSLTIGAATEVVNVSGESSSIVNTTDTAVGGIINRDRIDKLPLNGRSFLSIALLEPGVNVSYAATSGAGNPNNYFQVSIAGAPQSMTVISVDGSRVNDRVTGGTSQNFSAETVQEFQISTFGFDLSAGTVSAGAVNVVSRTGGNNFHGGGLFFFRDHNMAAYSGFKRPDDPTALNPLCLNPNSDACNRLRDPYFVRKQFGGTFGGPIKKDKLFFFGNYERNDQVGANSVTFSDPLVYGYNHVAQQPQKGHLGNYRMDYVISPHHNAFFRASLDSNNGVAGSGMESTWIASSNFAYQFQMGVTSVLKSNLVNDFRFSYSYFRNRLTPPSPEQCASISGDPLNCIGLGGPRITFFGGLQIGTNINVSQDRHPRTFQWTDNVSWTLGSHRLRFGGNWEHSNSHGTWNQNAPGSFSAFSPATLLAASPVLYNALPASLKIGYTGPRATLPELLQLAMTGTLSIGIGVPTQPAPFRYNDILANDLIRFYGQDAWQIRPGLTLNYGLGWSFENNVFYHDLDFPQYLAPILGQQNLGFPKQRYHNFDPAFGFAWALGKDQKTVIRTSASLHHISPQSDFYPLDQRILFGPAGNGLQAFTGSGLPNPKAGQPGQPATLNFTLPANFNLQDMLNYLPTAKALLTASNPYNGQDLSIRGVQVTKSVQGGQGLDAIYDSNSMRTPYTFHLDVGVQRELKHNLAVTADFVMRRGVGFGAFELFFPDLNRWNDFAPTYSLAASGSVNAASLVRTPVIPACVGTAAVNPNAQCSLGPIQYGLPGILSRYSALQVKVDKRFSQGFQFSGGYAFSKYTSLVSISNNNNLYDGFGRFTFSGIWELPKYKGSQWLARGALNGWQLSTIIQMQTGAQSSVTLPGTLDVDGDGTFVYRLPGTGVSSFGNGVSASNIRSLVSQYNSTVPAGPNTPLTGIPIGPQRDAIGTALPYVSLPSKFANGDSLLTHDIRITRTIAITEKVKLLVIGEGFNIFNVANLTGFSGTLDAWVRPVGTTPGHDPATFVFGQPTGRLNAIFGSGGPRAFQLGARLNF
jgi:hypothetical protein